MTEEMILFIQFSDGTIWGIPAKIIAENRAKHYANVDIDGDYYAEFNHAMENSFEITDWAVGNMDWEDVKEHAKQIGGIEANYNEEWYSAKKWIQKPITDPLPQNEDTK